MSNQSGAGLPDSQRAWETRATATGVIHQSVHSASLESASEIKEPQYVMLQVLWRDRQRREFDWKLSGLEPWKTAAKAHCDTYKSWTLYCEDLAAGKTKKSEFQESSFAVALLYQRQAANVTTMEMTPSVFVTPHEPRDLRKMPRINYDEDAMLAEVDHLHISSNPQTPVHSRTLIDPDEGGLPRSSYKPSSPNEPEDIQRQIYRQSKDEQIVNAALISFVNALTLHSDICVVWSFHRIPLKADFNPASYEARTDGYLEIPSTTDEWKRIRALVEVKAASRRKNGPTIRMQEAAQVVAWLKSRPDRGGLLNGPGRRILLSQDRHEIFITVAEYDDKYLDFLDGNPGPDRAFLRMHEFGPWNTQSVKDMKQVAVILVAMALRAEADRIAENL
ncbi:uncharacterized protein BO80DRAFT_268743 [Aspergillus ibericus CBS 121593]|uniref:Uncharacterized protein n=1 Tax=Aspergillus ibericus CBS 121593 TaxID=1448316 RepID=A0A395H7U1_9EURO|nr:hypothetical protein BO80DRAFT_268743 [Aspergillus ibericus CBS 121593]RAL03730.1 hypothetical protein BO80DRAFT_268743 [Aspergillus ibericus CBS 121593]